MIELLYQCTLVCGHTRQVSWIERRGAFVGAIVEIAENGKKAFWRVESVGETPVERKYLQYMNEANRNQRKASDI